MNVKMHPDANQALTATTVIMVILGVLINPPPTWLYDATAEGLGPEGPPPWVEYGFRAPFLHRGFFAVEKRLIDWQRKDSPSIYELTNELTMLQGTSANFTITVERIDYITKKPLKVNLTMRNYEAGSLEKPPEPKGLKVTFTPIQVLLEEGSRVNVTAILTVSQDAPDGIYNMIVNMHGESGTFTGGGFTLRIGADHPRRDIAVSFSYADKKDVAEPPSMIALHPGETAPLHMMITSLMNETRRENIDVDIQVLDEKRWRPTEIQGVKFPVEIGKALLKPGESTEALLKVETDLDAKPGVYPVLILINSTYYQLAKPVKIALVQDIKVEHTTTTTTTEAEAQTQPVNQYLSFLIVAVVIPLVIYLILKRRRTPQPC